jgi:DNA-binding MarR family transcriptional regulator
MLDKMSDVSRIVDRPFKKALVDKGLCITDKRLVDVFITDAGLTLLDKIDESMDGMDKMFAGITDEEAATLNQILDKLRD